jgi:hypothetical protein
LDVEDRTSEYTLEERRLLWECVEHATHEVLAILSSRGELVEATRSISNFGPRSCTLKSDMPERAIWNTLLLPLEDMPLHINDVDGYSRGTAIWRLKIGH